MKLLPSARMLPGCKQLAAKGTSKGHLMPLAGGRLLEMWHAGHPFMCFLRMLLIAGWRLLEADSES